VPWEEGAENERSALERALTPVSEYLEKHISY
jgi:hypothetical protein